MSDDQRHPEIAVAVRRHTDVLPPMPAPWEALERRHRNGLLRRGSAAATVVATAAAVLLAVATGLGSLTTQDDVVPAGPWPGDADLADGSAWAAELEQDAVAGVAGAEATVAYAADIDGVRVAMVRIRQPGSDLSLLHQWFIGPAGAPAAEMTEESGWEEARGYAIVLPLARPGATVATVLALSHPGGDMSVWTNDDVTRGGRVVSPRVTGQEIADGVYTTRLQVPFNHAHVELRGTPGGEWSEFARSDEVQAPPTDDAAWWAAGAAGARGDAAAAGPPERLLIRGVYNRLALPSQVPGSRVLWTTSDGRDRYSAVALRAPSGGWAVAGIHTEPPVHTDDGGVSEGSSVMVATPRPDGDPNRLSLAWYLDTDIDTDGQEMAAGDRLALVGPPTSTDVRLSGATADTVTVPLATGAGLVRREGVGTVEFLADDGTVLDRVEVTEPLQPNSRLPGAR
jgi:hypothetical protein